MLRAYFPRRWIREHPNLPGKLDFYLPGLKVAVFVDGCFWHSCPEHGRTPDTNRDYWEPKLARNRERDIRADGSLGNDGIEVIRIWEHELQGEMEDALTKLAAVARGSL